MLAYTFILHRAENCIDRHLADHGNRTALIWEKDEPNSAVKVSKEDLHH